MTRVLTVLAIAAAAVSASLAVAFASAPAASAAFHWPPTSYVGKQYCLHGTTVTSKNLGEEIGYDIAAAFGWYPTGPFWAVVWLPISKGACAAPAPAAVQEPPAPSGIFLCYSTLQHEPGVWTEDEAKALFAEGYWLPYAVKGNVAGGTNVGGYHLVCNIAATQSVSDTFAGLDGTILDKDYSGVFGIYPVAGS